MRIPIVRALGPAVTLGAVLTLAAPAGAEVHLGLLPRLPAVEMTAMFTPLAEYLTRTTGEKVTLVVPKDFEAFKALVASGSVELGFANPLVYVQLRKNATLEPLAVAAEGNQGTRFRGVFVVRTDSGISKLEDLRGKTLMWVDKDAAAGRLFQVLTLSRIGLQEGRDYQARYARNQVNVALAVFNRAAAAGGMREGDIDKMKDKVDLSQLRVIGYTDYFPDWPMFATTSLEKGRLARIREALLGLKPGATGTRAVMDPAKLAGFGPVADKDFELLREAAKLAGVY